MTTRDEGGGSRVIYVLPANPERIYVPVYDPGIVFSSSAAGAIAFGVGVLVGSAWNSRWAGTIADGIKSGSLRQCGVPRLPLGGRRIARAAGHRDPGDRIVPAIDLNCPAASRSVLAGPAVVRKFRMFGRSVLAGSAVVPKLQMFGRSVLVADPKVQTLGRSVPAGLVVVPKLRMFGRGVLVRPQASGLSGLPLAPRWYTKTWQCSSPRQWASSPDGRASAPTGATTTRQCSSPGRRAPSPDWCASAPARAATGTTRKPGPAQSLSGGRAISAAVRTPNANRLR